MKLVKIYLVFEQRLPFPQVRIYAGNKKAGRRSIPQMIYLLYIRVGRSL